MFFFFFSGTGTNDDQVKPRSLRFTWSMKTTSSRDPNEIMAEIRKVNFSYIWLCFLFFFLLMPRIRFLYLFNYFKHNVVLQRFCFGGKIIFPFYTRKCYAGLKGFDFIHYFIQSSALTYSLIFYKLKCQGHFSSYRSCASFFDRMNSNALESYGSSKFI